MKILSIVGARPQFIKLAPLNRAIAQLPITNPPRRTGLQFTIDPSSLDSPDGSGQAARDDTELRMTNTSYPLSPITHLICHTGQHFDEEMSKLFFEQLVIPKPDYNLGISGGGQAEQTAKMLIGIEEVLLKEKPDLVIVFGDTNSTLAGSLAAVKLRIKTLHIEAGLRSFNRSMPEEINRIISDHTSDYLFAPTQTAVNNLTKEGLSDKTFLTGDIMVDSLNQNIEKANQHSGIINELDLKSKEYYLLTLHRPYTVDDPANLKLILEKLSALGMQIIFPVHPRTKKVIEEHKIIIADNIKIIKPVGYLDFIKLEQGAEKIITDSGGIQKEAYILKKPCITLRPETEWVETVSEGWNILVLPDDEDFLKRILEFNPTSLQTNIFGSNVSEKMVNKIREIVECLPAEAG